MPSASSPKSILVCVVEIADAMRDPDSEALLGEAPTGIRTIAAEVRIRLTLRDVRSIFMGILRNKRMITRGHHVPPRDGLC
jgi:hypothetical protein